MGETLQNLLVPCVDALMAAIPRAVPEKSALDGCRLVSHRGEHDGVKVRENTLQAFADASAAGVWGIECDIRWTQDGEPVICHDEDTRRVFGENIYLGDTPQSVLVKRLPALPSLAALLEAFGGRTHLMLELKADSLGCTARRKEALKYHLAPYEPGRDFHILALDPALFELVDFLPPSALLPVSLTNTKTMSELSLQRGYAGLAGHFLLLHPAMQARHQTLGQGIGTGFPTSRNTLLREINRGVDWIFTNHALKLQGELDTLRAEPK